MASQYTPKYEVIQEMHDGFQQHIASANFKSEAQEVVDTFPHQYRHFGKLKIVKRNL